MTPSKTVVTARFWVETLFLFIVLIFCMVQLVRSAHDRPVYFTLISGICGKIVKLKIKRVQAGVGLVPNEETNTELDIFDDVDGNRHVRHPRNRTTQPHDDVKLETFRNNPLYFLSVLCLREEVHKTRSSSVND